MSTTTTARHLRAGMTLPSGFRVTHNPYRLTRTPKGRICIEGMYPDGHVAVHEWNASTTIRLAS